MKKDIKGYEGKYQITDTGEVYSNYSKRFLKKRIDNSGYEAVKLCKHAKFKNFYVHRLVALAFLENELNKPMVNHKDGNKLNNDLSNLEWCTRSENMKHAFKIGLLSRKGSKASKSKLIEDDVKVIRKMLSAKIPPKQIAEKFNISVSVIRNIKCRLTWTHVD